MMDKLYDWQLSYWQRGCNDAKEGKPADPKLRHNTGYINGFNYGQGNPRSLDWPELDPLAEEMYQGRVRSFDDMPDPPLKNPYMEAIEAIEGILQRLHTFHKEFPGEFAPQQKDDYVMDLLEVRDRLHEMQREDPYGE